MRYLLFALQLSSGIAAHFCISSNAIAGETVSIEPCTTPQGPYVTSIVQVDAGVDNAIITQTDFYAAVPGSPNGCDDATISVINNTPDPPTGAANDSSNLSFQKLLNNIKNLINSLSSTTKQHAAPAPRVRIHLPDAVVTGVRGSLDIAGGWVLTTGSPAYVSFTTSGLSGTTYVPFVVTQAAPGDSLSIYGPGGVLWSQPLSNFTPGDLYWATIAPQTTDPSVQQDLTYWVHNAAEGTSSSVDFPSIVQPVVSAASDISTVAGNGTAGYSGDGGLATSAELFNPTGAALDGAGNLYIADSRNSVIRMVSAATGIISTVAGNGTNGYSGDGGPATSAGLDNPHSVAVDAAGNLYIADTGNSVIRMVSAATGIVSTVAGNGTAGNSGDGGPATSARLTFPQCLALDGAGNLYIADTGNSVIRVVSAATGIISTVAGNGTAGYSGDGGPATSAELNGPPGVALDGAGNLYTADEGNARIRMISLATGIISTVAGNGTTGYSGDDGPATSAGLDNPHSVAVDAAGNLYIADTGNSVIRMVSAATGIISTVAGNGTAGYSEDGGPATSAELSNPFGVAVSSAGNLYIADTNNKVVREVTAFVVSASPPIVTPIITGTVGNNGWYTSNVQVAWTVSGGASTISSKSGCGTVTISTDTSGQTLTCSATSAGGGTTTQSVTIKRDATPPTISVTAPTNGATYIIGSTIVAAYSCADALSGPASCTGSVVNGVPISTGGTGGQSFMVSATDQAGNVAQTTVKYSVAMASQKITFSAIESQPADTTLALQARASSGLPVTYSSSSPAVCTVSGSTASLLNTGTCTITASQIGNTTYSAATPVLQSFIVTPKLISDTVTLGIASGAQTYGVYNSFAIGPSFKGSPVPTGTVTLYDNGIALVTLTLGSNGVAYYTANPLSTGVNVMTASYSGDSHYAPGGSAPVTLTITPAPVNLTGSCWGGTPYNVAYQCVITVSAGTATPPTGNISYSLDGAPGTSVPLSKGSASFTVATLPAAGAHKLTIAYPGQGNYAAGTMLTKSFTTSVGQTQLLISPSSYYLAAGSPITLTVTASTPQSGVPTGSITFYDNGASIGTATINNGVATHTVSSIPKGANSYTAKYAATANYAAATSGSAAVTAH